jgi:hypothetical protein
MNKKIKVVASAFLGLHGLVHLMGAAVYLKLAEIEGLEYKTALLWGRWELGESGIMVFGGLWLIAAIGFIVSGIAMLKKKEKWQRLVTGIAMYSFLLTGLDLSSAYAGFLINLVILLAVYLSRLSVFRRKENE